MRFFTTLTLCAAFGFVTAYEASSSSYAPSVNSLAVQSQSSSKPQPPVKRKLIRTSEVQASTQGQALERQNANEQGISKAPRGKILPNWSIRPDESSIVFKGRQTGDEFTGEFKTFTADIVFHEAALKGASVEAVIDMTSFDAGNKDRNEALPGKEWFFVKSFPQAKFSAYGFAKLDDGRYETQGELTIRDVSLPVKLPFDLTVSDDGVAVMKGSVEIDRSQFGVGQGAWAKGEWVDLNVIVDITIVADKRF